MDIIIGISTVSVALFMFATWHYHRTKHLRQPEQQINIQKRNKQFIGEFAFTDPVTGDTRWLNVNNLSKRDAEPLQSQLLKNAKDKDNEHHAIGPFGIIPSELDTIEVSWKQLRLRLTQNEQCVMIAFTNKEIKAINMLIHYCKKSQAFTAKRSLDDQYVHLRNHIREARRQQWPINYTDIGPWL